MRINPPFYIKFLQLEHIPGLLAAVLQRFQPEIRQTGSLCVVHVHFIGGHALFLVCIGVGDPHAGAEFVFHAAHGFQDIRCNEVLHKVLGEGFKDQAAVTVLVIDGQALTGHDLIIDLFDSFGHALAVSADEIPQFAVLDVDLGCFRVQGQLISVVIDQIQDPAIIRLQPDDFALGADLRLQDAAQMRIGHYRMCGLVEHVIASQAALLRNYAKFIGVHDGKISPAVQDILEIVL